jgi:hypothetical protein
MKHRYLADTVNDEVYDVLNKRASEKNGAAPTTDAAAGNVTRSARATPAGVPARTRARRNGCFLMAKPQSRSLATPSAGMPSFRSP